MLAPLVGGYVLVWWGWRPIFWLLSILGSISFIGVLFRLPETHHPEVVVKLKLGAVLEGYRRLLADRRYFGFALAGHSAWRECSLTSRDLPLYLLSSSAFRRTGLAGSLGPMPWVLSSPPKSTAGWFAVLSR